MGFFERLFGKNETGRQQHEDKKEYPDTASKKSNPSFLDDIPSDQLGALIDDAMRIVNAYGSLLEIIGEESKSNLKILLFPYSRLPYPKRKIQEAMGLLLEVMDWVGSSDCLGITIDAILSGNLFLENHFAPDEEVPDDPDENIRVWAKRGASRLSPDVRRLFKERREDIWKAYMESL